MRSQRPALGGGLVRSLHHRGHQLVIDGEAEIVRRFENLERYVGSRPQRRELALQHRAGRSGPVELRHRPRLPGRGASRLRGGGDSGGGHPVRHQVIRVAVTSEVVVADHHLRPDLPDHLDQRGHRGVEHCLVPVCSPEGPRVGVGRGAHHAAVAEPAGAAEKAVVGDAEFGHCPVQLGDAPAAELIGLLGCQQAQCRHQHLTLLTERAGEQGDLRTGGHVMGHRRAGANGFIVRMSMHEQQTPVGGLRHAHNLPPEPPGSRARRSVTSGVPSVSP